MLRIDAFGKELLVERTADRWQVFIAGCEGKKRLARDIIIPDSIPESEIPDYLADLLHEHARPGFLEVRSLSSPED